MQNTMQAMKSQSKPAFPENNQTDSAFMDAEESAHTMNPVQRAFYDWKRACRFNAFAGWPAPPLRLPESPPKGPLHRHSQNKADGSQTQQKATNDTTTANRRTPRHD